MQLSENQRFRLTLADNLNVPEKIKIFQSIAESNLAVSRAHGGLAFLAPLVAPKYAFRGYVYVFAHSLSAIDHENSGINK